MDSLATGALRERVLAAWTASPARFREDANAEEELALGAYRDRLVVELAQNAADAASRAGIDGRLLFRLSGSTLLVANTGAPLDAAGVEGLSTLRASTKHQAAQAADAVGRFGVGFAAVLAVTDEPAIFSHGAGARWSRAEAHRLVSELPELASELAARGDAVPVLRLPFPADPADHGSAVTDQADGYDTLVVLPLRDETAVATARQLLDGVDDALPLVLPALQEITIDTGDAQRTLTATPPTVIDESHGIRERYVGDRRWRLAQTTGRAGPELLSDRPVEERARPRWSVTVAVPVEDDGSVRPPAPVPLPPSVLTAVHAPTPTDDHTDLPALIIASFPLDSTRRRVAPGGLTDHLVERIGDSYARLVTSFEPPSVLTLVPGPMAASELDAALHRAVHDTLSQTEFIPEVMPPGPPEPAATHGSRRRLRPADVTLIDGLNRAADLPMLASFVSGIPATGWWRADILRRLGARMTSLADLVDELGALHLPAARWSEVYAALDGVDLEPLGALPVPLTDGRMVRGPRGVLLPGEVDAELLAPFSLRVVDPAAAHPLLGRLGAVAATAASVLRDPLVRSTIEAADDDALPALADTVIQLVAASGLSYRNEPWLAQLPILDATGMVAAAQELMLPDAALVEVLDGDPAEYVVAGELLTRHGADALRDVGVRDGFDVLVETDVPLDQELWHDLDGEDEWCADTLRTLPHDGAPPIVAEFSAVRDLDLVRTDAWPEVIRRLAADPATRAAVVTPAHVVTAERIRYPVSPYTAWWLRTYATLDGHQLEEFCTEDAPATVRAVLRSLTAVGEPLPDDEFMAAIGVVRGLADVTTDRLLARLTDEAVQLSAAHLMEICAELTNRDSTTVDPPGRVRVPDGTGSRVVDAAGAVVIDGPQWLQLGLPAAIPGTAELADLLDVDLADDVYDVALTGAGQEQSVPQVARALLSDVPTTYVEHDELSIAGRAVDWWFTGSTVHAATIAGLAHGLAWAAGRWERRWALAEALQDPERLALILAEDAFGSQLSGYGD